MKCPLTLKAQGLGAGKIVPVGGDCLKEECAWWDEPVKRCVLQNISEKLSFIYLELNEIAKNMPHERNYVK